VHIQYTFRSICATLQAKWIIYKLLPFDDGIEGSGVHVAHGLEDQGVLSYQVPKK